MGQYEIIVTTEYRYLVDANNQHDAVSIYLNDNDSCIPTNHGNLNIFARHIRPEEKEQNQ
jgi:deoxyxylulose-5-phosphate synthase